MNESASRELTLEGFSSVWLLPLQTESSLCYWGPGPAVEPGPTGSVGPGLPHEISLEGQREYLHAISLPQSRLQAV